MWLIAFEHALHKQDYARVRYPRVLDLDHPQVDLVRVRPDRHRDLLDPLEPDDVLAEVYLLHVLVEPALQEAQSALLLQAVVREVKFLHARRQLQALGEGGDVGVAQTIGLQVDLILVAFIVDELKGEGDQVVLRTFLQEGRLGRGFVVFPLDALVYVFVVFKKGGY